MRFYSVSYVAKLCPNVIVFGFIVIMLFKTIMFKSLRPKCYANFSFQFDIAFYLLIVNINIYTLFYMCFLSY